MDTEGLLAPETADAAHDRYADLARTASTVVKEAAKRMEFDRAEFDERLTPDVYATAHDALFASLLAVHVGTVEEFEQWCDDHPDYERHVEGSDSVDHVVWHPVPFAETVVAATYQHERDAAVGTLRRIAFGRVYREELTRTGARVE
ncbi:DUF5809 family protein [Halomarina oriensis]|uniref:Uncharacterized protein n=1 Tax=Halomarina oriensis TaxID=671145 RepID=A0A6B0GPA8_9EURY|nr:DUF5809 family protein [Halomarina oriensis]MWG36652.1 hypothetical protein [Halomarina oriensis]